MRKARSSPIAVARAASDSGRIPRMQGVVCATSASQLLHSADGPLPINQQPESNRPALETCQTGTRTICVVHLQANTQGKAAPRLVLHADLRAEAVLPHQTSPHYEAIARLRRSSNPTPLITALRVYTTPPFQLEGELRSHTSFRPPAVDPSGVNMSNRRTFLHRAFASGAALFAARGLSAQTMQMNMPASKPQPPPRRRTEPR